MMQMIEQIKAAKKALRDARYAPATGDKGGFLMSRYAKGLIFAGVTAVVCIVISFYSILSSAGLVH